MRLRKTIRAIIPDAEECLSYGMPAFRLRGKVIAGFLARADGCSYLPFSGTTLGTLSDALEGWGRTKSSLHFTPERPLPVALVKKLLRARIAELPAPRPPRPAEAPTRKRSASRGGSRARSS